MDTNERLQEDVSELMTRVAHLEDRLEDQGEDISLLNRAVSILSKLVKFD